MEEGSFERIPKHIGIIPDGNRRWAEQNNMGKQKGYFYGIEPGFKLYELMIKYGIKEATFFGFTQDNTKRPKTQKEAFIKACVNAVEKLSNRDANLLVIGNNNSKIFPKELLKYANKRVKFGRGLININFLVNYDWKWDLNQAFIRAYSSNNSSNSNSNSNSSNGMNGNISCSLYNNIYDNIASADISRIDLIIRWGGRRRLSGFLPIQSVYSDIYVIDDYWPNFREEDFIEALNWYQTTDITLGG
ncbi:MAG: polyprenyl diphosphate synthase [Clostridia bacterium]|nr:polyprenyl diphosphate synthase [Clostridia bacterium]